LGTFVVECRNWDAWSKRNSALPSILYVHAHCECPSGGYRIELRRATEQESDPAVLVLDLVIDTPLDPGPQAPELIEVQYWESTSQEYEEVHIRPDNIVLKISQAT
jgi:hypothetical protein